MKKTIITLFVCLVIVCCSGVFAVWAKAFSVLNQIAFSTIKVGSFDVGFECLRNVFVVDESFYNKYFEYNSQGQRVWRQLSANEIYEIGQITRQYSFIKTDMIYKVKADYFNFYYHGLPFQNTPTLNWGFEPVALEMVEGWSYLAGRIITFEGFYYRARHQIDRTPKINPSGWERINSISESDFEKFEDTCITNFYALKHSSLIRPYQWSSQTNYLFGDVVIFNNIEYICIESNKNKSSSNLSFWKMI